MNTARPQRASYSLTKRWLVLLRLAIIVGPLGIYALVVALFLTASWIISPTLSLTTIPNADISIRESKDVMKVLWALSATLYSLTSILTLILTTVYMLTFVRPLLVLPVLGMAVLAGYAAFKFTFVEVSIVLVSRLPEELRDSVEMVKDVIAGVVAASMLCQVACVVLLLRQVHRSRRPARIARVAYYLRLLMLLSGISLASGVVNVYYTHVWPAMVLSESGTQEELLDLVIAITLFAGSQATLYLAAIYVPAIIVFSQAAGRRSRLRPEAGSSSAKSRWLETLAVLSPLLVAPLAAVAERAFS